MIIQFVTRVVLQKQIWLLYLSIDFRNRDARRCSLFLKILQNIQENTSARSSYLIKLLKIPATLLKKRVRHRCFPINFAKFLRTAFLQSTSEQLLLEFYALKLKSKIKKGLNFSRNEYWTLGQLENSEKLTKLQKIVTKFVCE